MNNTAAAMRRAATMRRKTREAQVAGLLARGFDLTTVTRGDGSVYIRPRCSQCETLVLNGQACHELGCPNQRHECDECETLIGRRERLCEDCARPDTVECFEEDF